MYKDFRDLTEKERHIFVWLEYIYLLFMECKHYRGYLQFINNYVVEFQTMLKEGKNKEIYDKCSDATDTLKFLLGHHYHMWLFIELKKMLKEIIG